MSKREKEKMKKIETKSNTIKYVLEIENNLIIGWRTFAPWIHNVDKQDYDVMKWAKSPKIKTYIGK